MKERGVSLNNTVHSLAVILLLHASSISFPAPNFCFGSVSHIPGETSAFSFRLLCHRICFLALGEVSTRYTRIRKQLLRKQDCSSRQQLNGFPLGEVFLGESVKPWILSKSRAGSTSALTWLTSMFGFVFPKFDISFLRQTLYLRLFDALSLLYISKICNGLMSFSVC